MDRREVVERLAGLRREVEAEGEMSIAELETSFALALWDVCGAWELTEAERTEVLGHSALDCVQNFLGGQVWAVEARVRTAERQGRRGDAVHKDLLVLQKTL